MGEADKTLGMYIRISPSLRKAIKIEAAEEERSMNQVVVSALKSYFNSPKGQGPRKQKKG